MWLRVWSKLAVLAMVIKELHPYEACGSHLRGAPPDRIIQDCYPPWFDLGWAPSSWHAWARADKVTFAWMGMVIIRPFKVAQKWARGSQEYSCVNLDIVRREIYWWDIIAPPDLSDINLKSDSTIIERPKIYMDMILEVIWCCLSKVFY